MTKTHQTLHDYCKQEKQKAQDLSNSTDHKTKFNARQALVAWDELEGALYKPNPITPKRFEKVKKTALQIAAMMSNCQYKDQTISKIKQLEL